MSFISRGAALSSLFKRRRFLIEIILLCVRWYCKYGISYRDLAEMMQERGVNVDPSPIFRRVQRYVPEITKPIRPPGASIWLLEGRRCCSTMLSAMPWVTPLRSGNYEE
jgi:hypothetical protein